MQPLLKSMGGYQSGQMGQTVNLLAMPSVVRIHHHPHFPKQLKKIRIRFLFKGSDFFSFIALAYNRKENNCGRVFIFLGTFFKKPRDIFGKTSGHFSKNIPRFLFGFKLFILYSFGGQVS